MKPSTERFWSKVDRGDPDQCWEWKAATDRWGYGKFRIDEKKKYAHRVSYEFHHGPIPEGMLVLHSCDNPACVNPAHLHFGTHQDNMIERGERNRSASGKNNGQVKLTTDQVHQIRIRYATGGVTQKQLAEEFEVTQQQISNIILKRKWR